MATNHFCPALILEGFGELETEFGFSKGNGHVLEASHWNSIDLLASFLVILFLDLALEHGQFLTEARHDH